MTRFNNLRLAQRLGVAFGAMILALVVISALSVAKLTALDDGASALSDHSVVSQQKALQVSAAIENASALSLSHLYVHDGDLAAQDKIAAQIATVRSRGNATVAGLRKSADDPRLPPLIDRLASTRAQFVAAYTKAVEPLARRDRAQRRGSQRLARFLRQRGRPGRSGRAEGRRRRRRRGRTRGQAVRGRQRPHRGRRPPDDHRRRPPRRPGRRGLASWSSARSSTR